MIMIFDKDCNPIKTVDNDEELFCYIKQESARSQVLKENRPWQFNHYSHQLLRGLLKEIQDKAFFLMAKQACHWQSDMVCVHKGDQGGSSFFIAAPEFDLDLEDLKADWCQDYLQAHNLYMVTE